MSYSFSDMWHQFTRMAGGMDQQSWLVICAVGMVIGYFALRGFGSRNSY